MSQLGQDETSQEDEKKARKRELRAIINERGLEKSFVAETLSVSGRTVNRYLSEDDPTSPSKADLDLLRLRTKRPDSEEPVTSEIGVVAYPVLRRGPGAGPARVIMEEEKPIPLPRTFLLRWIGRVPVEAFWTYIQGESMEPWLPDGSPILVEKCDFVADGGRYLLWLDDEDGNIVKRVERLGGGAISLASDNPAHSTRELELIEDDMYRDVKSNRTVRVRVQGRIVYPTDTPHAILRVFSHQMATILRP